MARSATRRMTYEHKPNLSPDLSGSFSGRIGHAATVFELRFSDRSSRDWTSCFFRCHSVREITIEASAQIEYWSKAAIGARLALRGQVVGRNHHGIRLIARRCCSRLAQPTRRIGIGALTNRAGPTDPHARAVGGTTRAPLRTRSGPARIATRRSRTTSKRRQA